MSLLVAASLIVIVAGAGLALAMFGLLNELLTRWTPFPTGGRPEDPTQDPTGRRNC